VIRRFLVLYSRSDGDFADEFVGHVEGVVAKEEIDFAAPLWEEFEDAVVNATDLVVLWSYRTRNSRWVKYEFHLAYIHLLRESGVALHVIRADDSSVPAYLLPFCHTQAASTAKEAATMVEASEPPGRELLSRFVDRWSETGLLQQTLNGEGKGIVWLWGIPGVGKRSLVERGLERVIAQDPTRVQRIKITPGMRETELALRVSTAVGETPPKSTKAGRDDASIAIRAFASTGGIWVFENAHHWLLDDACPKPILSHVLEWLQQEGIDRAGFMAVFTATRKARLEGWADRVTNTCKLEGLTPGWGADLLRAHGATADEAMLRHASTELKGIPLALKIVAGQKIERIDWKVKKIRLARDVLGALDLTKDDVRLLETLAIVDGPLPDEEIAEHLGWDAERFRHVIARLTSYNLIQDDPDG
jgi:hypothetical protein